MPSLVSYPIVLERLAAVGIRCVYPNSGAFGFEPSAAVHICGWIGGEDETIRAELRDKTRRFAAPLPDTLAAGVKRAWQTLGGALWIMPASHWSYELQFGNGDWLGDALAAMGIDPKPLAARADGTAVCFPPEESAGAESFVREILKNLRGSDFTLAFADQPVLAMLHHHCQVWWQSMEGGVMERIAASV